MAAPNVTVTIEPNSAGSILVCELAPLSASHLGQAQLSLRFDVTNNEGTPVHLNTVALQFPGSSVPMVSIPADLLVAAGGWGEWHFQSQNNIILPCPGTSEVTARLTFDGYSTPITINAPLKAHVSPVPGGAYVFPFNSGSLSAGEYFSGRSAVHGAAGGGVQLFGYDIGVVAIDEGSGNWSGLHPGTNGSKNEHHRIWGKPIYAMADGTVVAFADVYPANPNPPADLSPPNPVEGNHYYIQHGDELVLYAHLQLGTLPSSLKHVGAVVAAGDYLGLVGNTGNSSGPHIHLHAIKGTQPWQGPPRPLPFRMAGTIAQAEASGAPMTPPWVDLNGRGIPSEAALIWPGVLPYNWKGKLGQYVAIDPLALLLSNEMYVKLTLPDPPPLEGLRPRLVQAMRSVSRAERRRILARVEGWSGWLASLAREIRSIGEAIDKEKAVEIEPPTDH